jgi:hypothetical protein
MALVMRYRYKFKCIHFVIFFCYPLQVRSARAVEDLQRKELEDQLEAEAYFSGLYKTQVREKAMNYLPLAHGRSFFWNA